MQHTATAYAIALGALMAAVLLRWLLDPVLGSSLPLVTLYGAIAAAVWAGGYRPAVLVAMLGYLACDYLFIAPRGELRFDDLAHVIGLVAYAFTCFLLIALGELMRRAHLRASERGELVRVTLGSIGDAVITTDIDGRVTYINAVAESLTGWTHEQALGQPLDNVFRIINEQSREPPESPAKRALRAGAAVALANHTVLVAKDGIERPIDDSAAPIRNVLGQVAGCVLIFRDISKQRRLELVAADRLVAARLLASIVESSDDAIISKSLDGIIQSWNAAAERLFGYTAAEAVGRHISLVIPPDRITEEDDIVASLKAGRRVDHFETERVRSDGRRILVSLTISPLKDQAGNVIGASKIVRDVTRQRQIEESERRLLAEAVAANAKFHAFFEQGALFASLLDVDGTIREANRRSWEGCGYAREQVVGHRIWEGPWWAPSPALAEQVRAGAAEAAAGRTFHAELTYFCGDGSRRAADVIIVPIKDDAGRVLFLAQTGADITDRKLAESERQKFVTLAENSTDFIGICDLDGVPIYINPAGLRMVGLSGMDEARRRHLRDFFFPEDQARLIDEFFPSVIEKGHGEIEIRFRNFQTGDARWMDYKVLTVTDESGATVGFATVSQDVTDRRRLEDNLRKLAADLSEADRRKNEFLATLSHELRNPLAPLRNMLEVLKRTSGNGAMVPALDTMERQLGQLIRLVDDLLDLNRITHNRIELRKGQVELASTIHRAIEACRPLAEAAGHRVQVTMPPEPIYVDADAARLTQVFGNLLHNSCKYTPSGGRIGVTVRRDADEAVVTIADNGIGIPPDNLDRIFEMFTQIEGSLERAQGGLGIGLTLVKRLVEMHGGSVEARSAGEGRGSEFVVRLPLMVGRAEAAVRPPAAEPTPNNVHRILVVDDNRDAALSLTLLLQATGHEAFTAYDGPAALEAAAKQRPDVILLDIGLPTISGYEVCRRVRAEPWGGDVLLIALTGWGQEEDRRKSHQVGFDGHLVKPVEYAALVGLLDSLVAARKAR